MNIGMRPKGLAYGLFEVEDDSPHFLNFRNKMSDKSQGFYPTDRKDVQPPRKSRNCWCGTEDPSPPEI